MLALYERPSRLPTNTAIGWFSNVDELIFVIVYLNLAGRSLRWTNSQTKVSISRLSSVAAVEQIEITVPGLHMYQIKRCYTAELMSVMGA